MARAESPPAAGDAVGDADAATWEFHLFVAGSTPRSEQALANLRRILDRRLGHPYNLEVIDLRDRPELAAAEQIVVMPAVVRKRPLPVRKLAGNFGDEARVADALDLADAESARGESEAADG